MLWMLAGVAAVALWLILLATLAFATGNPGIAAARPTAELAPQSPAIVDLITGGWRVSDEAAAATLLDLAARGAVRIEEIGPGLSLVRLGRTRQPLAPYEKLVYDHVRSLATADGVVATGALAEGARNLTRWWRGFRGKVIAEARAQGLSRPRWSKAQAALITVTAVLPAAAIGVAAEATAGSGDIPGVGAAVVSFGVLIALMGRLNGERGTLQGAAVAGHWLGVRAHLAGDERLAEQPAASVTIWGRHLAYAAALGLAPRAVNSLPISTPADDRRAWSDYGGMWHTVRVRYPRHFLWGRKPARAIVGGLVVGATAGFLLWVASLIASAFDVWPDPLGAPVACLAGAALAALPVLYAIIDLVSPMKVQGQVVRLRRRQTGTSGEGAPVYRYWVALDEGRLRDVKALGVDEARWRTLREGDIVLVRAGRKLGWVSDIELVRRSRYRDTAVHDDTGEHPVSLAEVRPFGGRRRRTKD